MIRKPLSLLSFVLASLVWGGCNSPSVQPTPRYEWFIFIADGLPEDVRKQLGQQLQRLICEIGAARERIHIIAAQSHTPIATFILPEGSGNARINDPNIASGLRALAPLITNASKGWPQLQLPQVASTVGSLRQTDLPARVVLVGDPIYDDHRNAGWSMRGGFVPTDKSLEFERSPFRAGAVSFPEGTVVSWMPHDANWGTDPTHRDAVVRFYRLFFEKYQATLQRFTVDGTAAFASSGSQFLDPLVTQRDGVGMRSGDAFFNA